MDDQQVRGEIEELERQLIAMANMVESLFGDATMTLIERSPGATAELRAGDYRAHERWIEVDKLCTELLTNGDLNADQIREVSAVIKMALDLKRAAAEAVRIGVGIRAARLEGLTTTESLVTFPGLAELAQGMLRDAIEAFINRDPEEAGGLHMVFRELASLRAETTDLLARGMAAGEVPIATGILFVGVAQRLESFGSEVLDIANQVRHLCLRNNHD